jgi:fatty acid desaturase
MTAAPAQLLADDSADPTNLKPTALLARPVDADRPLSDYSVLMAEVQRARLLDRSGFSYIPRGLAIATMIAAGLVAFLWLGQSWWQLVVAAYFAVVFAQVGFLGHDAGHQQVFQSKRANDRLGLLLSNFGVGLSYGWWVDKHNRHHRNPNDVAKDPDVQRNVIAWTPTQVKSQRGVLGLIARHQASFFFPLLLLEAINLHVGSVRRLLANRERRVVELALLFAHVAGCIGILLLVVSPLQALAFVAVQQGALGVYLGCSFAPNHKGMHIFDGDCAPDFLRRQVLTSRNVRGGRAITAGFGGLNYQIEHHLFPSMPSHNLRRCQPLVKAFCASHGVAYCETGVWESYARVLRYLGDLRPTSRLA